MTDPAADHQASPWHQPAPQRNPRTGIRTLIAGVAGVLVAVLVAGMLLITGVLRWGSSTATVNTSVISLPETLGQVRLTSIVAGEKNAKGGTTAKERNDRTDARTAAAYRAAFDGAAVAVRQYSTDDLMTFLMVIAVRADSPGLVNGPQPDPADLGLAASPTVPELQVDGDTECLRSVDKTVEAGEAIDEDDRRTSVCRTTAEGLTVYVFGNANGAEGHQLMLDTARAAKQAVVGS